MARLSNFSRILCAAFGVSALASSAAWAETAQPADAPPVAVKPIFNKGRSDRYFGGVGPYYPEQAAQHGVGGGVLMSCLRAADASLKACKILDEAPKGEHFGDAALLMAMRGWMKAPPAMGDAPPVPDAPILVLVPFSPSRR